jgi:hypothetical protein
MGGGASVNLNALKHSQPNRPTYVAEFWVSWNDSPGGKHHTSSLQNYANRYEDIVINNNSSINVYMFIGGTNFGFMNGGGIITSYDYDAPLSESGLYCYSLTFTSSYNLFQAIIRISIGRLKKSLKSSQKREIYPN